MALCCDRNGCIHRDWIVVEVDSRRIIERAIGHGVSNKIDDGAYQTGGCFAGDCFKLVCLTQDLVRIKGQALERRAVLGARGHHDNVYSAPLASHSTTPTFDATFILCASLRLEHQILNTFLVSDDIIGSTKD